MSVRCRSLRCASRRALSSALLSGLALVLSGPANAVLPLLPIDRTSLVIASPPDFQATVNDEPTQGDIAAAVIMPGQSVRIRVKDLTANADPVLDAPGVATMAPASRSAGHTTGEASWRWQAPDVPGLYRLLLRNRATAGQLHINVFVQTPVEPGAETLEGYDIGHYQREKRDGQEIYAPPTGLIRVTQAMASARLMPGVTIADLLCHQQPEQWPKYLLVKPRLLTKLAAITQAVRDTGTPLDALTIMSGYRTPWYNADIGNTTVYSRHLYGGAADIFVDTTGGGEMDDLNRDGQVDTQDAEWLADLIETVDAAHPEFAGGLSAYPGNAYHGPFVHVDVRGTAVRW